MIARIFYFVEHHWNELLRFSRRSEYAMNRWAARYGFEKTGREILDKAIMRETRYGFLCYFLFSNHQSYKNILFKSQSKITRYFKQLLGFQKAKRSLL